MPYAHPFAFLALALACFPIAGCVTTGGSAAPPFAGFDHGWEQDPTWSDGKAEVALYDASRTVYGKPRSYTAKIMTDKEHYDPAATTKADGGAAGGGIAVFKHHLREDIPTKAYTYHYSTMSFSAIDDLRPIKLDMGSAEDCGASFKQFIRAGDHVTWDQFSYLPDQGHRSGAYATPDRYAFADALSLTLRGYPFDDPRDVRLSVLPGQRTNSWGPVEPVAMTVRMVGQETLGLPIGEVEVYHLRLTPDGDSDSDKADQTRDYWFAADGSAPRLHVMVQYKGPHGITYKLQSQTREAYWDVE